MKTELNPEGDALDHASIFHRRAAQRGRGSAPRCPLQADDDRGRAGEVGAVIAGIDEAVTGIQRLMSDPAISS